jgi:hypothetical protein
MCELDFDENNYNQLYCPKCAKIRGVADVHRSKIKRMSKRIKERQEWKSWDVEDISWGK